MGKVQPALTGVSPVVPKTLTSSGAKRGLFTRQDFIYDTEHDHYTRPAGTKLTKIYRRVDHTEDCDRYRHLSACWTGDHRGQGGQINLMWAILPQARAQRQAGQCRLRRDRP